MKTDEVLPHRLQGIVNGKIGAYYIITCPEAPDHLKYLNLTPFELKGAKVGDQVTLEYRSNPASGLKTWRVVEVHK
jgi:hypothetical protein